jgi:hypothetical protein
MKDNVSRTRTSVMQLAAGFGLQGVSSLPRYLAPGSAAADNQREGTRSAEAFGWQKMHSPVSLFHLVQIGKQLTKLASARARTVSIISEERILW